MRKFLFASLLLSCLGSTVFGGESSNTVLDDVKIGARNLVAAAPVTLQDVLFAKRAEAEEFGTGLVLIPVSKVAGGFAVRGLKDYEIYYGSKKLTGDFLRYLAYLAKKEAVIPTTRGLAFRIIGGAAVGVGGVVVSGYMIGDSIGNVMVFLDEKYNGGQLLDKVSRIMFYPLEHEQEEKLKQMYGSK